LFTALNDEVYEVRELAMTIIGRLVVRNPAYVMPSLRKTLIELLADLEFSGNSRTKEEAARLLNLLIRSSEELIQPYVETILNGLLKKLGDPHPRVASNVLSAIGEISVVAGEALTRHFPVLLPLLIETIQDQSSTAKREVAYCGLGQLIESTGYAITPYHEYPNLMDILLHAIQTETTGPIRKKVIKVFGILGALDPHTYKLNKLRNDGKLKSSHPQELTEPPQGNESSEEYYPSIVFLALMRVMSDPTLSVYYVMVMQAVMTVFKKFGIFCVSSLPVNAPNTFSYALF
jgi:FKBP12-rapamycin complex-associated protein